MEVFEGLPTMTTQPVGRRGRRCGPRVNSAKEKLQIIEFKIIFPVNFSNNIYIFTIFTFKTHTYLFRYTPFYKRSIYEFSLQRSVLICTYFSLNELRRYNKQLTVVR
jgi:hypothetical protein